MKDHVKKHPKCVKDAKLLDDDNTLVPLLLWIFLQGAPLDVFKTVIAADQRMCVKRLGRDHLSRIFLHTIRDLEEEEDDSCTASLPALSFLVDAYPYALTGEDHQLEVILCAAFFHNSSKVRKKMIPILYKTVRREDMAKLVGLGGCIQDWGETFPHDVISHLTDVVQYGRINQINLAIALSPDDGTKPLHLSVEDNSLEATIYHDSFGTALSELKKCSVPLVSIRSANDLTDAHDILTAQTFTIPPHVLLDNIESINITCGFTKVKELDSFLHMLKCMPNLTGISLNLKFSFLFENDTEQDPESQVLALLEEQGDHSESGLYEQQSPLCVLPAGDAKITEEEGLGWSNFLSGLAQNPLRDLELNFSGSVPVHGLAQLLQQSKTMHTLRVCDTAHITDIEPIAQALAANTALEVLEVQGQYDLNPLLRALSDSNFTLLQFYGDRPDARLDHYCQLNKMGRGKLKIEEGASPTEMATVNEVLAEAAAYGTLSTLYGLLRFRPDLWATYRDENAFGTS